MSQIYQNLQPTNGKVLLVTSVGEIDIELGTKEAPKGLPELHPTLTKFMELPSPS